MAGFLKVISRIKKEQNNDGKDNNDDKNNRKVYKKTFINFFFTELRYLEHLNGKIEAIYYFIKNHCIKKFIRKKDWKSVKLIPQIVKYKCRKINSM